MKPPLALVLLLVTWIFAFSQEKITPDIKKGNVLTYQVSVNGEMFPVQMRIDSLGPEYSRFNWTMQDGNTGNVINTKRSLESATHAFWGELHPGEDQTMSPDQSILILSKILWNNLQKDKKFILDEQEFTVKEQPSASVFKLKDKAVNTVYAESANGAVHLWFLNNPQLPILLKIEGNPLGVNVNLQSID